MRRALVTSVAAAVLFQSTAAAAECLNAAELAPESKGCLLQLGDAADNLMRGISKGKFQPSVLSRALGARAKTRKWSAPDRDPSLFLDYVEISTPLVNVRGVRARDTSSSPYHVSFVTLRDPAVRLPCGLRVGHSAKAFARALGSEGYRHGNEITYIRTRYVQTNPDSCSEDNLDIVLRVDSKNEVRQVHWETFGL